MRGERPVGRKKVRRGTGIRKGETHPGAGKIFFHHSDVARRSGVGGEGRGESRAAARPPRAWRGGREGSLEGGGGRWKGLGKRGNK